MKISGRAIVDYTRPRIDREKGIDTSGDSPVLQPGPGEIAGGVQGYLMGQLPGAIGGVVGAYTGRLVSQKSDSKILKFSASTLAGAALSTATAAGLAALTGAGATVPALAATAVVGGLAGLSGSLASEPGGTGIMSGGIQGFISNRISGAASGSIGGYIGVRAGVKTGSTELAVLTGSLAGAAVGAASTAGLAAIAGQILPWQVAAGSALLGGFAGAVGTLAGSMRSAPRDAVYGGMVAGMIGASYTGNPALGIAGAAAAGYAARAKTRTGQVVLGTLVGAGAGFVAGLPGGLETAAVSALAGAIIAPVGSVGGTAVRQVMRNGQVDLIEGINSKWIDPYLAKNKIGDKTKIAAGAAAGGILLGSLGMVGGLEGVAVMGGIGAVVGAYQTHKLIKTVKQQRDAQAVVREYMPIPAAMAHVLEHQKAIAEGRKPAGA